jgi:hypothetical protein
MCAKCLRGWNADGIQFLLQVLTNVLTKLKIENAVWCPGKNNNFYQVKFTFVAFDLEKKNLLLLW